MFRFAISKKTWVLYTFVWFYTHSCGFIHIRVVYTHMCTVYTHMRAVFHQQCSMFIYLLMKIGTAACFFSWFGFKVNICVWKLLLYVRQEKSAKKECVAVPLGIHLPTDIIYFCTASIETYTLVKKKSQEIWNFEEFHWYIIDNSVVMWLSLHPISENLLKFKFSNFFLAVQTSPEEGEH